MCRVSPSESFDFFTIRLNNSPFSAICVTRKLAFFSSNASFMDMTFLWHRPIKFNSAAILSLLTWSIDGKEVYIFTAKRSPVDFSAQRNTSPAWPFPSCSRRVYFARKGRSMELCGRNMNRTLSRIAISSRSLSSLFVLHPTIFSLTNVPLDDKSSKNTQVRPLRTTRYIKQ